MTDPPIVQQDYEELVNLLKKVDRIQRRAGGVIYYLFWHLDNKDWEIMSSDWRERYRDLSFLKALQVLVEGGFND